MTDASNDNVVPFRKGGGIVSEFDCVDCGVRVLRWGRDNTPKCAQCQFVPGWHRDPTLAALLGEAVVLE